MTMDDPEIKKDMNWLAIERQLELVRQGLIQKQKIFQKVCFPMPANDKLGPISRLSH